MEFITHRIQIQIVTLKKRHIKLAQHKATKAERQIKLLEKRTLRRKRRISASSEDSLFTKVILPKRHALVLNRTQMNNQLNEPPQSITTNRIPSCSNTSGTSVSSNLCLLNKKLDVFSRTSSEDSLFEEHIVKRTRVNADVKKQIEANGKFNESLGSFNNASCSYVSESPVSSLDFVKDINEEGSYTLMKDDDAEPGLPYDELEGNQEFVQQLVESPEILEDIIPTDIDWMVQRLDLHEQEEVEGTMTPNSETQRSDLESDDFDILVIDVDPDDALPIPSPPKKRFSRMSLHSTSNNPTR